MSCMPRLAFTGLVLLSLSVLLAIIGDALEFGSGGYLAAVLVGMLLTSLTDRERFWGASERRSTGR